MRDFRLPPERGELFSILGSVSNSVCYRRLVKEFNKIGITMFNQSDPMFKEKLAIHSAICAMKWHRWKGTVISLLKNSPEQFSFPTGNDWTNNVVTTFQLFFPKEYAKLDMANTTLGDVLLFIERFVYA